MVKILPARKSDLQEILELQHLAFTSVGEIHNDLDIPPLNQTLDEIEQEFKEKLFIKLVYEEQIIGSVRGEIQDSTAIVERLIVHPEYQNQGYALLLMRHFEKLFSTSEKYHLFTGNKIYRTLQFYQKFGYKIVREEAYKDYKLLFLDKRNSKAILHSNAKIKVVTYLPKTHIEALMDAITLQIKNPFTKYSRVFSYWEVTGTWKSKPQADPYLGDSNSVSTEVEYRLEFQAFALEKEKIKHILRQHHPYEEPAIEIFTFES